MCAGELDRPEAVWMSCPAPCSLLWLSVLMLTNLYMGFGCSSDPAPFSLVFFFFCPIGLYQVQILHEIGARDGLACTRCIQISFVISARVGVFN